MEQYDEIRGRCSVRVFVDRPVDEEALRRVLDTGRLAPSARNRQARKIIVVRDAERRSALAAAADQLWIAKAPVLLAVVGTEPECIMHCGVPADPVDCAIAIDLMTLAAVAEGLGTCWLGHFNQDACCELLEVPPGARIIELVAMGYPAAEPTPKHRKPFDEVVCMETFH